MKFQILSDLHLEHFYSNENKAHFIESLKCDVDYILLTGDITSSKYLEEDYGMLFDILGENIIFISGNHEYYNSHKQIVDERLGKLKGTFLNNRFTEINENIVVLGGTGWHQEQHNFKSPMLNDFLLISDLMLDKRFSYFWHNDTYEYFESMLNMFKSQNKRVICLTHNAPLLECTPKQYKGDELNQFFVNDWSDVFKYDPILWVYGHLHGSKDFMYKNTRCIENSLGYVNIEENDEFDKNLIIEIYYTLL